MNSPGQVSGERDPAAQFDHALSLHQQGRLTEAAALYEQILASTPRHFETLHMLGALRSQTGNLAEAHNLISAALAVGSHPLAFLNRGLVASAMKQHEQAIADFDRAIALDRHLADAFNARGNAQWDLKRGDAAIESYRQAIALNPNHAEAHNNLGTVLAAEHRPAEACASFDRAIGLRPDFAEAFSNRGNALLKLGRMAEAIENYDRAIVLRPGYVRALENRAAALCQADRREEALATFARILELRPDDAGTYNERGYVLNELGRYDEARANLRKAIALRPDFGDAHWNLALVDLITGDFKAGWPGYEWRWRKSGHKPVARNFTQPIWTGVEDLTGRTILLHGEQGYGDSIQFCRYIPAVAARGARVIVDVPAALVDLMRTVPGVSEVFVGGAALPPFDFQCPLMSLPRAFGTEVDSIPTPIPYLTPDAAKTAAWRERLDGAAVLKVGLVWSGSATHHNDSRRSISLERLLDAIPPGIAIYSLQKEVRADDRAVLSANPRLHDFSADLHDFSDTAALVSLMDVVISVDTSVAHLAGALGVTTWLMLAAAPDWRWLTEREDSPWYPSMRLFRQATIGDWGPVVAAIRARFRDLDCSV